MGGGAGGIPERNMGAGGEGTKLALLRLRAGESLQMYEDLYGVGEGAVRQ
jgi:hypothetical protein